VSGYRRAMKKRDERAVALGYVPRPLGVPSAPGSLNRLNCLLADQAHKAMLRRITSA
jgi:hypothetical protein